MKRDYQSTFLFEISHCRLLLKPLLYSLNKNTATHLTIKELISPFILHEENQGIERL